jgi:ATP-dependent Lon protease
MDNLDLVAAKAFEGYVVRKDLVRQFKGQYPVPTYVVEFLLGRYCASTDDSEIQEGLGIVQKQLSSRAVRAGEEELSKAQARDKGSVKVLDMIRAKLDARNDCYVAELPSLRLSDIRIDDALVKNNDRMLTGGFYAEVDLGYDGAIAQERNGKPFSIESLREIQIAKSNILDVLIEGRKSFGFEEWKDFLLRSVGLEPEKLSPRTRDVMLLRMVPFVERNYNLVELGPRGTGKSHLYEQVSPYAHLVSGGKATVAQMFVNNSNGQRGLVCQYDVICFDEIAGISFEKKEGVNIMKGYMESGKFSRGGPDKISAEGGIVMVGNFDVDVEHQQRIGHLLGPMPPEMRDDTAFMDRIHSYVPGWDVPKMGPELFTDHFGLVCDFLSSSWRQLRNMTQIKHLRDRVILGGALSGRDINAVNKTASGLLKLTYPDVDADIPDDSIEWAVRLAIESRRRIKEQQKRIGAAEYRNTHFSYTMGDEGVEKFVSTPELKSEDQIDHDPLPPGQVFTISPGSQDEHPGLYKIEINESPGSGYKILNKPTPTKFRESADVAIQNLYSKAQVLVGDRDPKSHEFNIQLRAFDASKSGSSLGVATLLGLGSALLQKSLKGGMVVVGNLNLGGSVDELYNAVSVAELAVEKGAVSLLVPVTARKQLAELSDDMITKISIHFYSDARDALLKALVE